MFYALNKDGIRIGTNYLIPKDAMKLTYRRSQCNSHTQDRNLDTRF